MTNLNDLQAALETLFAIEERHMIVKAEEEEEDIFSGNY